MVEEKIMILLLRIDNDDRCVHFLFAFAMCTVDL